MKKRTLALLTSAAVAGIYSAVKGSGPFNTLRFREVHDRVRSYVDCKYPTADYMPISKTQKGYVTTVIRYNMPKIILYITRDREGNYIFSENIIEDK